MLVWASVTLFHLIFDNTANWWRHSLTVYTMFKDQHKFTIILWTKKFLLNKRLIAKLISAGFVDFHFWNYDFAFLLKLLYYNKPAISEKWFILIDEVCYCIKFNKLICRPFWTQLSISKCLFCWNSILFPLKAELLRNCNTFMEMWN